MGACPGKEERTTATKHNVENLGGKEKKKEKASSPVLSGIFRKGKIAVPPQKKKKPQKPADYGSSRGGAPYRSRKGREKNN